MSGTVAAPALTVAVCTRDRPHMLAELLDALGAQGGEAIAEIVVVDQGRRQPVRPPSAASCPPIVVVLDDGEGLSRARNLAVARARTGWIAFLDDDCLPEPGWARRLAQSCAAHPAAGYVSGTIAGGHLSPSALRAVSLQRVRRAGPRRGRWRTSPLSIGQGASFAVKREAAERLGGWDERLGAGTRPFPAGEDFDFNYRFLREGGVAYLDPDLTVMHRQWRSDAELPSLHAGYIAGNAGCAVKHLRTGDLGGGAWLWLQISLGVAFMFAGAVRSGSPLHRQLAVAQARGWLIGTVNGFRCAW